MVVATRVEVNVGQAPYDVARAARLKYVEVCETWIVRRRCGKSFRYVDSTGKQVSSLRVRDRIAALVIPPAWRKVLICPIAHGHIQAVGFDARGRKQFLYHERWRVVRSSIKFDRLSHFAEALPRMRRQVRRDLAGKQLTQRRVLAAIVRMIDRAHLRIGNDRYTKANGSHGATTLLRHHTVIEHDSISFDFPAKSGQRRQIELKDLLVARVLDKCLRDRDRYLFHYRSQDGQNCRVTAAMVNRYLREISGEAFTAKDFRTWWELWPPSLR